MASTSGAARLLLLAPLVVAMVACGDDGDSSSEGDDTAAAESTGSDDPRDEPADTDPADTDPADTGTTSDSTAPESGETDAETEAPAGTDGAAATLTLANGDTFEFATVLCSLEPQVAAGSEILFTATSYDDPGLDITQFGDDGTITGVASISVYDGDYESLWEANSMFGSNVELSLDGSTIRGTGSFLQGGDISNDAVEGEVVANC